LHPEHEFGGGGSTDEKWFQVLRLLIGMPCLLKGVIGLSLYDRFYPPTVNRVQLSNHGLLRLSE
jgi:hypothetical protein